MRVFFFSPDKSLLVYRNIFDLCILNFISCNFTEFHVDLTVFLIECLGFFMHKIGEGNGTPLQYSCLENPMDRGAWKAAVHGVTEGWTQLSDFTSTFHFHALEKDMATHSSVLAWRIPGMGSLVGCHLWGRTESWTRLKRLSSRAAYIKSCHLQTNLCFPVQFGRFLFFLPDFSGLDFQCCWLEVMRVGILVLFLVLGEQSSVLHLWVWH